MMDNIIRPIIFDSLENVAFQRNAPPRIPKIIHQMWFSDKEPSEIRKRLHRTFKEVNPDY